MGTGFTIDTCLKVARFGIHSVISLGDDELDRAREGIHCNEYGIRYEEIAEAAKTIEPSNHGLPQPAKLAR